MVGVVVVVEEEEEEVQQEEDMMEEETQEEKAEVVASRKKLLRGHYNCKDLVKDEFEPIPTALLQVVLGWKLSQDTFPFPLRSVRRVLHEAVKDGAA